jgi:hypothetical protein
MRRRRRGSSRVAAVWGGSGGRCGDRHEEQQLGFVASASSSTSVRRPPAFLHASCCNSCAPPAGKRHGCAALVVPDSGAPGQPVEFYVSARHHQVSPSVGCCRRGDEDSSVLFGDTSSGPRQLPTSMTTKEKNPRLQ